VPALSGTFDEDGVVAGVPSPSLEQPAITRREIRPEMDRVVFMACLIVVSPRQCRHRSLREGVDQGLISLWQPSNELLFKRNSLDFTQTPVGRSQARYGEKFGSTPTSFPISGTSRAEFVAWAAIE